MTPRGQKRKRAVFSLHPDELRPELIAALERALKDKDYSDPRPFEWIIERVVDCCRGGVDVTTPATDFDDAVVAADAVGVKYNSYSANHAWERKENQLSIGNGQLSDWAGTKFVPTENAISRAATL